MQLSAAHAFGDKLPSVELLTALAGDYWYRFFHDQVSLKAINGGLQQEIRQLVRELHEQAAAGSFLETPQYHTETFWPLLVDPATVTKSPIAYGQGYLYGGGTAVVLPPAGISSTTGTAFHRGVPSTVTDEQIYYGDVHEDRWRIPIANDIRGAAGVSDETVHASAFYSMDLHAHIVRVSGKSYLELPVNPAEHFRLITDQYDRERLVIWLYMAQFERYMTAKRYGVLFDVYRESSSAYLQATRAVLHAYTRGASELRLRELLAAAVGEQLAEQDEAVVDLMTDSPTPVIITDRRTVYGTPGRTPAVVIGDTLDQGDFFFETVRLTSFEDGSPAWLTSWIFPTELTGLSETVTVPAGPLPLLAVSTVDGTRITFGELPAAFSAWLNGSGNTLAAAVTEYLQLNVGNPSRVDPRLLPATLDVLDFLSRSPLRYSVSVSLIDSRFLVDEAASLLRLTREVVPPWVTHLPHFNGSPPRGWAAEHDCSIRMPLLS